MTRRALALLGLAATALAPSAAGAADYGYPVVGPLPVIGAAPVWVGPSPFAVGGSAFGLSGFGYYYDEPTEHRLGPARWQSQRAWRRRVEHRRHARR